MHRIYYTLIFITVICILSVDCNRGGGRGRGGGGSRSYGGRGSRGSSSCKGEECKRIVYAILGISAGFILLVIMSTCCCRKIGTPSVDNATFVRSNRQSDAEECRQQEVAMINITNSDHHTIFRNGMWSSRYYQYGNWNGPFELELSFNPQTWKLRGWGQDNVGKFYIIGLYSSETYRMGITKAYIKGTGDINQNLGHDVTIQLTRNTQTGIFEGKWYVNTNQYSGDDKFELQFVRDCQHYDNA